MESARYAGKVPLKQQGNPMPVQPYAAGKHATFQFADKRASSVDQRQVQAIIHKSPQVTQALQMQAMATQFAQRQPQVIQKRANSTGLPDQLKSGVESLSGISMNDVKVHYNSSKPATLQAHAYAQGTQIHIARGQEKHLPHEAWHVVQQKQGRVRPTTQLMAMEEDEIEPLHAQESANPETTQLVSESSVTVQRAKAKSYYYKKLGTINRRKGKRHGVFNRHLDSLGKLHSTTQTGLMKLEKRSGQKMSAKAKRDWIKKILKHKRDLTEARGEWNATKTMEKAYPNSVLIYGFQKGIGIDQVWQDGDTILVVEAKGPGAKLGSSARKGDQMSKEWVMETAHGMSNEGVKDKILAASKKKGKLKALLVTSTLAGNAPRAPRILWSS